MVAAGFTGGEAEELRRAMGFKRSERRMKQIETKLREGMKRQGITGETIEKIVQSIVSMVSPVQYIQCATTSLSWPIRWTLAVAWAINAGFHSGL